MIRKTIITLAGLTLSTAALAQGAGIGIGIGAGGYAGQAQGYTESATTGGGMSQTASYGTGVSAQFTTNQGSAYAGAGGVITSEGVTSYTSGGSTSYGVSGGFVAGNGSGQSAGAVGQDFSSSAHGSWATAGFGAGLGAFAGLEAFTW